jgi:tyrosyl-tRNA synthetase
LFYQFWLNAADADAAKWIKIFTFLSETEITALLEKHAQNPGARELQKTLAREVTSFVHGEAEYQKAIETTEKLFAQQTAAASTLTPDDLENMEGIIKFDFAADKVKEGIDVVSFLAESGVFSSKGEARKTIQGGGVSINRNKVADISLIVDASMLLHSQYLLVQKGKKNYYLVKVTMNSSE